MFSNKFLFANKIIEFINCLLLNNIKKKNFSKLLFLN